MLLLRVNNSYLERWNVLSEWGKQHGERRMMAQRPIALLLLLEDEENAFL